MQSLCLVLRRYFRHLFGKDISSTGGPMSVLLVINTTKRNVLLDFWFDYPLSCLFYYYYYYYYYYYGISNKTGTIHLQNCYKIVVIRAELILRDICPSVCRYVVRVSGNKSECMWFVQNVRANCSWPSCRLRVHFLCRGTHALRIALSQFVPHRRSRYRRTKKSKTPIPVRAVGDNEF